MEWECENETEPMHTHRSEEVGGCGNHVGAPQVLVPLERQLDPLWGFHPAAILSAPHWRVEVGGVWRTPVVEPSGLVVEVYEQLSVFDVGNGCHADGAWVEADFGLQAHARLEE